jgi:D-alanine-D-alanine ligase
MQNLQEKIRVGVLRGGPSPEYEVSLATGKNVLDNLPREYYEPLDIYISRDGEWHDAGMVKKPENILNKIDVAWNGLHGSYGEDGTVQRMLENVNMPFTGADSFSAALSMNKAASKKIFERSGLKTPFGIYLAGDSITIELIREAYNNVPAPFVVKPVSAGSSVGVRIVHSLPELEEAIVAALEFSHAVLVEEFIRGKEATCGVVENFRNREVYPLMPIEIRHSQHFFDYDSKYSDNGAEEICPGNFSYNEKQLIEEMAREAHRSLGLRHYSRSDFRIHPTRGVFILETNSLPGLTKNSLIPKALDAAGAKLSDFLHHIISLTLRK